ncbi:MAG: 2-C-methyl-D-erythritol 2,4-cyclodiphosphate synthase [Acidiferrobacterales bacterium]
MRIGHGYDVHALVEGRDLVLGGVRIDHPKGLAGHSDADALIHAICDACLGALGFGDLGHYFSDSDPKYKGINSRELLEQVAKRTAVRGWQVINVDSTVIAQAPRLAPHLEAMKANIAADLGVGLDQINIKATTAERLGSLGREEGIAVHAVVLLERHTTDRGP